VTVEQADLAELADDPEKLSPSAPAVKRFYQEALGDYIRAKPDKWRDSPTTARAASWYATREKFGLSEERVPNAYWRLEPLPPSAATAGWLKYRRIRYAKSRARAA